MGMGHILFIFVFKRILYRTWHKIDVQEMTGINPMYFTRFTSSLSVGSTDRVERICYSTHSFLLTELAFVYVMAESTI